MVCRLQKTIFIFQSVCIFQRLCFAPNKFLLKMTHESSVIKQNGVSHNQNDKFPYFTKGIIVKGFGRGSKELGIPTGEISTDFVVLCELIRLSRLKTVH